MGEYADYYDHQYLDFYAPRAIIDSDSVEAQVSERSRNPRKKKEVVRRPSNESKVIQSRKANVPKLSTRRKKGS